MVLLAFKGWDPQRFQLQTSPTPAGPWTAVKPPPVAATDGNDFVAKIGTGDFQLFEGWSATSRYWRWSISTTGGNQPWVKEVVFRNAK